MLAFEGQRCRGSNGLYLDDLDTHTLMKVLAVGEHSMATRRIHQLWTDSLDSGQWCSMSSSIGTGRDLCGQFRIMPSRHLDIAHERRRDWARLPTEETDNRNETSLIFGAFNCQAVNSASSSETDNSPVLPGRRFAATMLASASSCG